MATVTNFALAALAEGPAFRVAIVPPLDRFCVDLSETSIARLREAYAIVAGVPAENVDLSWWVSRGDWRRPTRATVACAGGLLALHPGFSRRTGLRLAFDRQPAGFTSGLTVTHGQRRKMPALAAALGFEDGDPRQYVSLAGAKLAHWLFRERSWATSHRVSDKRIFLARVRAVLLAAGAITHARDAELRRQEYR